MKKVLVLFVPFIFLFGCSSGNLETKKEIINPKYEELVKKTDDYFNGNNFTGSVLEVENKIKHNLKKEKHYEKKVFAIHSYTYGSVCRMS